MAESPARPELVQVETWLQQGRKTELEVWSLQNSEVSVATAVALAERSERQFSVPAAAESIRLIDGALTIVEALRAAAQGPDRVVALHGVEISRRLILETDHREAAREIALRCAAILSRSYEEDTELESALANANSIIRLADRTVPARPVSGVEFEIPTDHIVVSRSS